jgi:hypothetical protein
MAKIIDIKDTTLSIGQDSITRTREKMIEGKNIEELLQLNLIPQYGSRHPENSRFRLTDGNLTQIGNSNGMGQFLFTGTYTTSKIKGVDDKSDVDPWELGAQNFSVDYFTVSTPVKVIRDETGKTIPFVNSAKCPMQSQRDLYGREISFLFCKKYRPSSNPNLPAQPIVNASTDNVAGETLSKYSSLLFPPSMRIVTDYADDGNLRRSYWEISCKIRIHPLLNGWFEDFFDVGTLALDDSKTPKPAPIYRYYPWENAEDKDNLEFAPAFGTIQRVIAAKAKYARAIAKGDPFALGDNAVYWQAYQELPFEEITEPLPLKNGKVYVEAMADPQKYPYQKISGTVFNLGNFSQYDLPSKREG